MSMKKVCDGCGEEMVLHGNATIMELWTPGREKYDLCASCTRCLHRWLEGKA